MADNEGPRWPSLVEECNLVIYSIVGRAATEREPVVTETTKWLHNSRAYCRSFINGLVGILRNHISYVRSGSVNIKMSN